jgi:hypothetical protein
MHGNIELFNGIMNFNPILMIINSFLILHFIYSYYNYCFKQGFKLDYWHFNIMISFFIPILIMYPFSASIFNSIATGNNIFYIREYVNYAYIISIVGYISFYIGFYYHDLTKKKVCFT